MFETLNSFLLFFIPGTVAFIIALIFEDKLIIFEEKILILLKTYIKGK